MVKSPASVDAYCSQTSASAPSSKTTSTRQFSAVSAVAWIADSTIGKGVGAREIVRTELFQRNSRAQRLGSAAMLCTYVSRVQRSCTSTFTLPRGTIVVSGVLGSRLLYELAIVGGTGVYDDARGTLTTTAIKLRPRRDLLLFRLAG